VVAVSVVVVADSMALQPVADSVVLPQGAFVVLPPEDFMALPPPHITITGTSTTATIITATTMS
jgi:hypothetical protein